MKTEFLVNSTEFDPAGSSRRMTALANEAQYYMGIAASAFGVMRIMLDVGCFEKEDLNPIIALAERALTRVSEDECERLTQLAIEFRTAFGGANG